MKISVDPSRCYGSHDCVHRAPSVFTLVNGYVALIPGREDAGDEPEVREAAMWCPSQAIALGESVSR
ncbi:ferredoxin [Streptomyces sp. NPDC018693]|uniref:ferredoxin n=1 Tax=unclassified Streptomyces TaxID=2593676 RepID=UPI0037AC6E75